MLLGGKVIWPAIARASAVGTTGSSVAVSDFGPEIVATDAWSVGFDVADGTARANFS
ncbi:hypothetical protein G3I15_00565 [Streptomyces sp. SID10244]|nr:hypothetical protein [Streptomyces sp. SID10244]